MNVGKRERRGNQSERTNHVDRVENKKTNKKKTTTISKAYTTIQVTQDKSIRNYILF